jgi:hypothetical protein
VAGQVVIVVSVGRRPVCVSYIHRNLKDNLKIFGSLFGGTV